MRTCGSHWSRWLNSPVGNGRRLRVALLWFWRPLGAGSGKRRAFGIRLLADMRTVLGTAEAKTTVAILDRLHKADESPWADIRGKPLSDLGLARRSTRLWHQAPANAVRGFD